jgi:hypothetical protein
VSALAERPSERRKRLVPEEDEPDELDRRPQRLAHGGDGDLRRELDRIAVHAGRDRREGDTGASELCRELERATVAARKQLGLTRIASVPDRADRVDDMAGRQPPTGRRLGVTGLAPAEEPALLQNRRTARAVDRAVDAPAAEQARVGSVDDRVVACSVMSPRTASITRRG